MKLLLLTLALGTTAAFAPVHETDCPFCKVPVTQNTEDQDNEVVLKFGNKKIEYSCIACVFKDQGRYRGDLVVYAPSETVGEPVILKRTEGKWSAPEKAVFINAWKEHKDCARLSRAFSKLEAFEVYAKKHAPEAKPLTLAEFEKEVAKK